MDDKQPDAEPIDPDAADPGIDGPDDELTSELVAYLDGELDRQASEAVGAKISLHAAVRSEADTLKKTWDLLDYLPRPEPSPTFTERTVSKIEPLLPIGPSSSSRHSVAAKNGQTPASHPSATMTAAEPSDTRRSRTGRFIVVTSWLLALFVAAGAGYFARGRLIAHDERMKQQELDARIPSELRLLHHLHDFRHIDDLEFLEALDSPELFGDEQAVSMNEGSR